MTDQQWETLKKVINGEKIEPLPVGFIADSPWLPGWYGIKILDYFSNDELWESQSKASRNSEVYVSAGWPEFGMCTDRGF